MNSELDFSETLGNKIKNSVIYGLMFGLPFGIIAGLILGTGAGIFFGFLAGFLFIVHLQIFSYSLMKASTTDTNTYLSYQLENGEMSLSEIPANHTENNIAVGGKLLVTNLGIRFIPHKLMENTGSLVFIPYKNIAKTYIKKGSINGGLFSGGLVSRIAIDTKKQGEHLFRISKPQKLEQYLNQMVTNSF